MDKKLVLCMQSAFICKTEQRKMNLTDIRAIRKSKGISILRLSKLTGINRDRISLIERGKVNPLFDTVKSIVEALNCKLSIEEKPKF